MSDIVATALALLAKKKAESAQDAANNAGGAVSTVSDKIDAISNKNQQIWAYQDFAGVTGTSLTLSANSNGSGWTFDASKIINGSAALVLTSNESQVPYTSGVFGLLSSQVSIASQIGSAITLSGVPRVADNNIRIWYKINIKFGELPSGYSEAPAIILQKWIASIDTAFATDQQVTDAISAISIKPSNTRYISATGSDVADGGSLNKPWATPNYALAQMGGSSASNARVEALGTWATGVPLAMTADNQWFGSALRMADARDFSLSTVSNSGFNRLSLTNAIISTSLSISGAKTGHKLENVEFASGATISWTGMANNGFAVFRDCVLANSSIVLPAISVGQTASLTLSRCSGLNITMASGWSVLVDDCTGTITASIGTVASINSPNLRLKLSGSAIDISPGANMQIANSLPTTPGMYALNYAPANGTIIDVTGQTIGRGDAIYWIGGGFALRTAAYESMGVIQVANRTWVKRNFGWADPTSISVGYRISYQSSSSTFPASPNEGDWMLVTSDGTKDGALKEQWTYDGASWILIQGAYPVSGAVIDNTIADSALATTVGRYIVPNAGLSNLFIGHANQFADYDGTNWTFSTPSNNSAVTINSGPNAGQTWKYLAASGWSTVITSAMLNMPAWVQASSYSTGDVARYSDGRAYIANGSIAANTAWALGTTGATWQLLAPTNILALGHVTSITQQQLASYDAFSITPTSNLVVLPAAGVQRALITIFNNSASFLVYVSGSSAGIQPGCAMSFIYDGSFWRAVGGFGQAFTSIATAGGTTSLVNYSNHAVTLTGSSTQTIKLPSSLNLKTGGITVIKNDSTSASPCVVQNSAGTELYRLYGGETVSFMLESNTTAAGLWDVHSGKQSAENVTIGGAVSTASTAAVARGDTVSMALGKLQAQNNRSNTSPWTADESVVISTLASNGVVNPYTLGASQIRVIRSQTVAGSRIVNMRIVNPGNGSGTTGDFIYKLPTNDAGCVFDTTEYPVNTTYYTPNVSLTSDQIYALGPSLIACSGGFIELVGTGIFAPILYFIVPYSQTQFRIFILRNDYSFECQNTVNWTWANRKVLDIQFEAS